MTPKIFSSPESWIEGDAIRQLEQTANLPGVETVFGMPDLHPGKGCAVGTVAMMNKIVYPHIIGNDIGCGYTLFQTDIPTNKVRLDKWADMLVGLDETYEDADESLESAGVFSTWVSGFGTVGGGNHFAELQKISDHDEEACYRKHFRSFDHTKLVLLIHSGSRGYGESIFRDIVARCGADGLEHTSEFITEYIQRHDDAVRWASASREIIGKRLLRCLKADGFKLLDIPHNFVELHPTIPFSYVHRKGAAPADRGLSPLPGSRGAPTYLLEPLSDDGLKSLAHGAGRKASRGAMNERVKENKKQMSRTAIGSMVVCGDETHMREEHASAYKNVEQVVLDLETHGLAKRVATMTPVLTYKSENKTDENRMTNKREKEETWRKERREKNRR